MARWLARRTAWTSIAVRGRLGAAVLSMAILLAACGGGGTATPQAPPAQPPPAPAPQDTFTISGTVEGLDASMTPATMYLDEYGLPDVFPREYLPAANGPFRFATPVPRGTMAVVQAPYGGPSPRWRCVVPPSPSPFGSTAFWVGTVEADVADIAIRCGRAYTLAGTVRGLTAGRVAGLRLLSAGQFVIDDTRLADGDFVLVDGDPAGALLEGMPYELVSRDGGCRVSAGSGVMPAHDVEGIVVDCDLRRIGYRVAGLLGGFGLEVSLARDSGQGFVPLETDGVAGNGGFGFDHRFAPGERYRVTVTRQPFDPAQTCSVERGEGTVADADIDDVVVRCVGVEKTWRFDTIDTLARPSPLAGGRAVDEEVYRTYTHALPGPASGMGRHLGLAQTELYADLLDGPGPNAAVYSSADGRTYWIATEAPAFGPSTITSIETRFGVQRAPGEARFTLQLSAVQLAGRIEEGLWLSPAPYVRATAEMEVRAHKVLTLADGSEWVDPAPFHRHSGVLELEGRQTSGGPKFWRLASWVEPGSGQALWERDKFVLNTSGGNNLTGNVGHAVLREAIDVSVNLAALAEGERALIVVGSRVRTLNRFNGESLVVAYLRDPVTLPAAQPSQPGQPRQAVTVTEISGLTLSAPPALPEGFTPQPGAAAPACASAALPRAVLQFGAAAYSVFEDDAGMRVVTVTRGGSTQGEVTARVRATAGTATAGVDFAPLDVLVRFGDGDATPRSIVVPVQDDTALEGPKTLTLSLSEAAGCADLGVIATATVTIEDDETPASAGFTIGGTVSGLAGSGLVVETLVDTLAIAADGTFQFARTFPTGYLYRVQVTSQPQDPRQACTVANGEGTVGSAAVTNVQITCTTLAEPGSLDPGFGSGGRAWSDGLGPPVPLNTKMARQADGKLLVVGGGSGVLRLLADGTPDAGFGPAGNGVAAVPMAGGDDVNLASVAVQPDGRILVAGAGRVGVSGRFDMLVARLHANGTLDTGFAGGTGIGRFDHAAWNDGATQVLVQADGSILLAGSLADGSGVGTDFAVLRLSAAGLLDTAYGSNGWARVNVGGGYDVPRAAVLAPDGGVVLAGRVGASGGSNGDIGLAKFTAAGLPDAGFGSLGNGTLRLITTAHDEARDIVVLADGRLVVVGERASTNTGGPALLWLARYLANGQPDTTFGSAGVATLATPLAGWAVAVQADGTVWAAGGITSADGSHTDYGLARFTAAGQPDAGFGTGGLLGIDFFGSFDTPATLVVQPDGKVVLAGSARNGSTYGLGVVRVVP